ncbi:MAG: hypothetical protein R2867_26225 [Caldilineaceae bacterium]
MKIVIEASGITIDDQMGAKIELTPPQVSVNSSLGGDLVGLLIDQNAVILCTHGGSTQIQTANTRKAAVVIGTTVSDLFTVAGCPFTVPGPKPQPCVKVQESVDTRRVNGSLRSCKAAPRSPECRTDSQGAPNVVATPGAGQRTISMNITYPYRFDHRKSTAQTGYDAHIRDPIEQVLFTAPGERVNRVDSGTGVAGAPLAATAMNCRCHPICPEPAGALAGESDPSRGGPG